MNGVVADYPMMSPRPAADDHRGGPQPTAIWHQPVLAASAIEWLRPRPGSLIVDGTLGTGGHSLAILPQILPDGRLIAVDRDPDALAIATQRLTEFLPQVTFVRDNYRNLPGILAGLGLLRVDGILLDLGISSLQVDQPERGFSFSKEGPLDMRMDPDQPLSAETLIKTYSVSALTELLGTLGEERYARRIAERIVRERRLRPITATTHLARVVAEAVPPRARHGRLHPATRTFQALRLAVNDELGSLAAFLDHVQALVRPGGRVVILSYQSLDDRLVKQAFIQGRADGSWTLLTKKPIRPAAEEIARNPRARSAKLRAVERTG